VKKASENLTKKKGEINPHSHEKSVEIKKVWKKWAREINPHQNEKSVKIKKKVWKKWARILQNKK